LAETFEFGALEAPAHLIGEPGTAEDRLRMIAIETRRRAHEDGLADGLAEAGERIGSALACLAAAEAAIRELEDEFLRAAERSAVELAIAIAEKIVGGTVQARPEMVLDVVGGALLRTAARHRLVIEVNPDSPASLKRFEKLAHATKTPLIAAAYDPPLALVRTLVRAGAHDVVPLPLDVQDLETSLLPVADEIRRHVAVERSANGKLVALITQTQMVLPAPASG